MDDKIAAAETVKLFANVDFDMRLDAIISKRVPCLSKNDANYLCGQGKVKINGIARDVKAGQTLQVGDMVEVDFSELNFSARPHVGAKLLPMNIIFEDEHLLIINKPRKLHSVTHKESAAAEATLADAIASYCPACVGASKNPLEAGLVQRLDYYTCGLIIAAKNKQCHKMLSLMLLSGQIHKTYLALVDGVFSASPQVVKTGLKSNGKSVSVVDIETLNKDDKNKSKNHSTENNDEFLAIKETTVSFEQQIGGANTLIKASASAAYRHQVRAHLAFIGFPLTGDALYASKETLATLGSANVQEFLELSRKYRLEESGYDGFFLCANALEFIHPITKEKKGVAV